MLENLDRLKAFYHVFASGSVVEAANTLHVTQPAVSQAVQKLEAEIQSPLFIRQHKQLIPTSAGARLFDVVQPFMSDLEVCLQSLAYAKDHPYGELRIGSPPEFGKTYLPTISAAFRGAYPDVTFALEFASSGALVQLVGEGKLDFALVDLFLLNNQLVDNQTLFHFEPVFEETVILGCSQKYYEENIQGQVTLDVLTTLDFIEYTTLARTAHYWFRHHFNAPKVSLRTVMTVDNHDAVVSAIKHHTGLGVLASHLVVDEIESGEIVPIRTTNNDMVNQIALVQLQDKVPTLTEKMFKDFMVDRIRQIGVHPRVK